MNKLNLTKFQTGALVTLRVLIGWHFLYEGIIKVMNPEWSALIFLRQSKGIFACLFNSIASNNKLLVVANFLNEWSLIVIGIFLIIGLFSRTSAYCGLALLLIYYIAVPPFIGYSYSMPSEGSYLIVNKNLIEASALLVLALFPTGQYIGLDILFIKVK